MILPERVFGRSSADDDLLRPGELADLLGDVVAQLARSRPRSPSPSGDDEGDDRLAGQLVGDADHGGLGDLGWPTRVDSTSIVESRWPETLMTSSIRPTTQK